MGKQWKQCQTLFFGAPKSLQMVTAAMKLKDAYSLELDSILKSRDITLPTKVHLVKAMVSPVVMYGCESWTVKKTQQWPQDWKDQFTFQSQRRAMPENVQTTTQLHLFHMLAGSFQTSQLFASGGQSIGVSASTSVLPMNIEDWFPLGLTGWISLQSKGLWRVFSNTTVQKH